MRRPSIPSPKSAKRVSRPLSGAVICSLFLAAAVLGAPPTWWIVRQVLDPAAASRKDDYAAANVGQVKTLAKKAAAEMEAAFGPQGGAGTAIQSMVASWAAAADPQNPRDDFAVVNAGQLKSIAKPFYDRLIALGLHTAGDYPWSGSSTPKDDYAAVNVGQVKTAFAFEIDHDFDNDGMNYVWERAHNLDGQNSADAGLDADGDHLTNLQEFRLGTNPTLADTNGNNTNDDLEDFDGDGLNNFLELAHNGDVTKADTDGDGIGDLQEYKDATELNNRFSFLRPLAWARQSNVRRWDETGALEKISGGSTQAWNAGAAAGSLGRSDCRVRWQFKSASVAVLGLNLADSDFTPGEVDYAIQTTAAGTVAVYELGVLKHDLGSYTDATVFDLERAGSTVKYSKNGLLVYTSTVAATAPLVLDASFAKLGSKILNARYVNGDLDNDGMLDSWEFSHLPGGSGWEALVGFSPIGDKDGDGTFNLSEYEDGTDAAGALSFTQPVIWTGHQGTAASGTDGGLTRIGTASTGTASSTKRLIGNGRLHVSGLPTGSSGVGIQFSLSTDYAVAVIAGNLAEVRENGVAVGGSGNLGPFGPETIFTIERTGSVVKYLRNGIVKYTSTVPGSGFLTVRATFAAPNQSFTQARLETGDVDNDALPDHWELTHLAVGADAAGLAGFLPTDNLDGDGASNLQEFLDRTNANSAGSQLEAVTWTSLTYAVTGANGSLGSSASIGTFTTRAESAKYILGDGKFSFRADPGPGVTPLRFGLSSRLATSYYLDLDFAIHLQAGFAEVYEQNVLRTGLGAFTVDTVFAIERSGTEIRYLKDGNVLYTSTMPSGSALAVTGGMSGSTGHPHLKEARYSTGDSDADGMSDRWEFAYLAPGAGITELQNFLPGADADTDGITNLVEFQDATSPTNATSRRQPVVWTAHVGTISVSTEGGLQKSGGSSAAYDSDAVSTVKIVGDGDVRFRVPPFIGSSTTYTNITLGLNIENNGHDEVDLDFAIRLINGKAEVAESGTLVGPAGGLGVFSSQTLFAIERVGSEIRYLKDGVVCRVSTLGTRAPLLVDTSLSTLVSSFYQTFLNGGDLDTDGMPDAWEYQQLAQSAGLTELQAYLPTADQDGDGVNNLQEFKDGTNPASNLSKLALVTWTSHVNTVVDGSEGGLRKNAGTAAYNADAVSTTRIIADGRLKFRLATTGQLMVGLNVENLSRADTDLNFAIRGTPGTTNTAQIYEGGVSVGTAGNLGSYGSDTVFQIERVGLLVRYWKDGILRYTSAVQEAGPLLVDTSLLTVNSTILEARMAAGDVDADLMPDAWELTHVAPGSGLTQIQAFLASADKDGDGASNLQEFRDRTDAGNAQSYLTPITWTAKVNTTSQNSNGGLKKTYATGGYNADGISTAKIIGDARLSIGAVSGGESMIGLTVANVARTAVDLDHAIIFLTTGLAEVRELGVTVGTAGALGAYGPETIFGIERVGTQIRYLKNGVVKYTSAVPSSGVVIVDTAFNTANSIINEARLSTGDFDGDEMSDVWEYTHLAPGAGITELQNFLATADKDGDDASNLQEFRDGTDASNASSLFRAVAWTDLVNTTQASVPAGANASLQKTSGTTNVYNADAISTKRMLGDGRLSFRLVSGGQVMVGLTVANRLRTNLDLDYGILAEAASTAEVQEEGTVKVQLGEYTADTIFAIERVGTQIRYLKDGIVKYTSTVTSDGPLMVDTSFYTLNAQVGETRLGTGDVDQDDMLDTWEYSYLAQGAGLSALQGFLPTADLDGDGVSNLQEFRDGTSPNDDISFLQPVVWGAHTLTTSVGTNGGLQKNAGAAVGYNAEALGVRILLGDGRLNFRGLGDGQLAIGFGIDTANQTHADLEYSILFTPGTEVAQVHAQGVSVGAAGNLGNYGPDTIFSIERAGTQIRYYKNGVLRYTSPVASFAAAMWVDTSFYTAGAIVGEVRFNGGDNDNDGMADAWELAHLPPGSDWQDVVAFTPHANADGDSVTNLQEFINRTDPRSNLSYATAVLWKDFVKTADFGGGGLVKTTTVDAADADAVSTKQIVGNGRVTFSHASGGQLTVGLNNHNELRTEADLDFAIRLTATTSQVVQGGTPVSGAGILGPYTIDTVFAIERVGSEIRYLTNGIVRYVSEVPSGGPLLVDTCMYHDTAYFTTATLSTGDLDEDLMPDHWELAQLPANATLSDLQAFTATGDRDLDGVNNLQEFRDGTSASVAADYLSPVVWTSHVNSEPVPGGQGGIRPTTTAAFGTGAEGTRALVGDGRLSFRGVSDDAGIAIGLNHSNLAPSDEDLDYAIVSFGTAPKAGLAEVYESTSTTLAASVASLGAYTPDTIFAIERVGDEIRYYKDGVLRYVSTKPCAGRLLVDCSLSTVGKVVTEVRFKNSDLDDDELPDVWEAAQIGGTPTLTQLQNYSPDANADGDPMTNRQEFLDGTDPADPMDYASHVAWQDLVGTESLSSGGIKRTAASTADARSTKKLVGDGRVNFSSVSDNANAALGFNYENLARDNNDLDYSILATATGVAEVHEGSATVVASLGAYGPHTQFSIERVGTEVRYYMDGIVRYVSTKPCSGLMVVDCSIGTLNKNIGRVTLQTGDLDDDGMSDAWEFAQLRGATTLAALQDYLPTANADGDEVTNLQEFRDGTDPADALNFLVPVRWHDAVNTQYVGINGELIKVRGTHGAYDADAVSTESLSSTHFVFRASPVGLLAVGLNTSNAARDLADLNYAILLSSTGAQVCQNGVSMGTPGYLGAFGSDTVFRIDRVGTQVSYLKDGIVRYVSTVAASGPLVVDTSFCHDNSAILEARYLTGDKDGDGMPDEWELRYTLNPEDPADAAFDNDQDGLTNGEEAVHGLNPLLADTDFDFLPDPWEVLHDFNGNSPPSQGETRQDPDADGLTNIQELQLQTDPRHKDTDRDGMPDGWEFEYSFNPAVGGHLDAAEDADGDTLTNLREYELGTNPRLKDSDGDFIPDDWEIAHGLDPKSRADGSSDKDGDQFLAWEEYENGTSPDVVNPGGGLGAVAVGPPGPLPGTSGVPPTPTPAPTQGRIVAYASNKTAGAQMFTVGMVGNPATANRNSSAYTKETFTRKSRIDNSYTLTLDQSRSVVRQDSIDTVSEDIVDIRKWTEKFYRDYDYLIEKHYVEPFHLDPTPTPPPAPKKERRKETLVWSHAITDEVEFRNRTCRFSTTGAAEMYKDHLTGTYSDSRSVQGSVDSPSIIMGGPMAFVGSSRLIETGLAGPWERFKIRKDASNNWVPEESSGVYSPFPAPRDISAAMNYEPVNPSLDYSPAGTGGSGGVAIEYEEIYTRHNTSYPNAGVPSGGVMAHVGNVTTTTEKSIPVPWLELDRRLQRHLNMQPYPPYAASVSGPIGTATYTCSYSGFTAAETPLRWFLYYEIPPGLTQVQIDALPPKGEIILKEFRDPSGTLVASQYIAVTLEAGKTSPMIITSARDRIMGGILPLPDGGTVTVSRCTPVEFITPAGDPVSSPVEAGTIPANIPDGANEFTFSDAASGVLTIKLKAKVPDMSLMPPAERAKFTFEVDPIGSSTLTWDRPGGKATVSGDFITATATFTGLPENNTDFGLKKARVKHDGNNAGEAEFEVFFPKNEKNHPGDGSGVTPNWFYYWKNGEVCGIPPTAVYDATTPGLYGYVRPGTDTILRLGKAAPGKNDGPYTLSSTTYGSITNTGQGKGIQCVAETVAHELHHLTLHDRSWQGWFWTDSDSDGVDNSDEPTLDGITSDPSNPDTYDSATFFSYPSYATYGDDEVRCRKIELTPGITVYPKRDWANPGCQSFIQFGPPPPP